jgi:hypothetical protein
MGTLFSRLAKQVTNAFFSRALAECAFGLAQARRPDEQATDSSPAQGSRGYLV